MTGSWSQPLLYEPDRQPAECSVVGFEGRSVVMPLAGRRVQARLLEALAWRMEIHSPCPAVLTPDGSHSRGQRP